MKSLKIIIPFLIFSISINTNAQFLKKLKEKAVKKIESEAEKRTQRRVNKKIDKVYDKTEDKIDGKTKKKKKNRTDDIIIDSNDNTSTNTNINNQNTKKIANTTKDFIPGNKVIFSDSFQNDALGDFPVTWNTNSSGEIVTFNNDNTKWLKLGNKGQFTPDSITNIPQNSTFEFDLYVSKNYNFYSTGFWVNFIEVKDKRKDFTKWKRFNNDSNGVRLWLHPVAADNKRGRTEIKTYINKSLIIENKKNIDEFTKRKNSVRISIWRQKTRIRVYIDGNKVWDLPRAFGNANYNSIVFGSGDGKDQSFFYISNLRLAIAGEDKRHVILEYGKFETNKILFDTGKSNIQASSYSVLNELGKVLQENLNLKLKIIGHTDNNGSASANQILSEDRAKSVKQYFITHFLIDQSRLQTEGKGESKPVDTNTTQKGKKNNRRVEFIKL